MARFIISLLSERAEKRGHRFYHSDTETFFMRMRYGRNCVDHSADVFVFVIRIVTEAPSLPVTGRD
jgi:hypothetical protein